VEQARSLRPPNRTAADIARQLRDEFFREMHAVTGAEPRPDPVLAAVFHALAHQIDRVYREADQEFFLAALDDLIRGLGMPARLAKPAQAVVQFSQIQKREAVSPETELIGYRPNGEQIVFAPDLSVDITPTELVFAAVFEAGQLQTVPGARLPPANQPILPGNRVALELSGAAPMVVLAFETDPAHLSRLGLFLDIPAAQGAVAAALARSPWQLLNEQGMVSEPGVLRATRTRGGAWQLRFFREPAGAAAAPPRGAAAVLQLTGGVYGSRLWVFPEIPPDRRYRCRVPPALAAAVPRLLPPGQERALDRPLAWVQVPLPAGLRGVVNAIGRVAVGCVTASNVEVWSEQVDFDRMGSVVIHRPYGSDRRHMMGVLSVHGETGDAYVEVADLEAPATSGRYRYGGGGRFEFSPARQPGGRFDSYAMLRLLYCDGEEGNGIAPGEIKQIRSDLPNNPTARVASLTPSKGGASPPAYADARGRFAELLRTRERLVTAADIEVAVRSFEPNVRGVQVESASEITGAGLGLVTRVTASVSPGDFADPEAEFERLAVALERYLAERSMIGHRIAVTIAREAPR
jgi:hypothetical protein